MKVNFIIEIQYVFAFTLCKTTFIAISTITKTNTNKKTNTFTELHHQNQHQYQIELSEITKIGRSLVS